MDTVELKATVREAGSKGKLRRLRLEGQLPGILYGVDADSVPIQMPAKELEQIITSRSGLNTLIRLEMEGTDRKNPMVMIKHLQRDPIRRNLIHIDLQQISLREKLQTEVRVALAGTPEGVKEGGILQVGIRNVEVECLPTGIPDALSLDVTALNIGDKLTVADLDVPEGIRVLADPETLLATVLPPKVEAEPVTAPEAAEPEPEKTETEKTEAEKTEAES